MERDTVGVGNAADGGDGLDRSHPVVGVHDRDQDSLAGNGPFDLGRIDQAVPIYRQVSHLEPLPFQVAAGVEDRQVFDLGSDDMIAAAPVGLGDTL